MIARVNMSQKDLPKSMRKIEKMTPMVANFLSMKNSRIKTSSTVRRLRQLNIGISTRFSAISPNNTFTTCAHANGYACELKQFELVFSSEQHCTFFAVEKLQSAYEMSLTFLREYRKIKEMAIWQAIIVRGYGKSQVVITALFTTTADIDIIPGFARGC